MASSPSILVSSLARLALHDSNNLLAFPNLFSHRRLPLSSLAHPQPYSPSARDRPTRLEPRKPVLRATKAALSLTPAAVKQLHVLSSHPSSPRLIRIGVRNKGCAGMSYHLEYVDSPAKFDEVVEQDGVKVLIDSKALFSIIGSEMDWTEDRISSRFAFKNPNVKDTCGCGESFTT